MKNYSSALSLKAGLPNKFGKKKKKKEKKILDANS